MEAEKLLDTHKNQTTYGANKTTLFMPNSNRQPVKSGAPDLLGELSSNQVQVYIWKAKGSSVGHISLRLGLMDKENKNIYISYFPKSEVKNVLQSASGMWVRTLIEDRKLEEGRWPEFTVILNELDTHKMKKKFEEIEKLNSKWHLLASTPLKPKEAFNCISVVVEVLRAGEIEDVIGEEIIKSKRDEWDQGLLPYKKTSMDMSCKSCCGCCSCCIQCISCCCCCIGIFLLVPLFFLTTGPKNVLQQEIYSHLQTLPLAVRILFVVMACSVIIGMCCKWTRQCINKQSDSNECLFLSPSDMIDSSSQTKKIIDKIGQGFYDTLRGLYEHSLVPDGRIIEILEKAKKNEQENYSALKKRKNTNEVRIAINQ